VFFWQTLQQQQEPQKRKRKGGAKGTKVLKTNVQNHHVLRPKKKGSEVVIFRQ
jgi:hypothetical protein